MDPTTSFVLALSALIVSVVTGTAAFIAVAQTAVYHPKPYLLPRVKEAGSSTNPGFAFSLTNMGRAPAHDVRLVVRDPSRGTFEQVREPSELGISESEVAYVSKVSGSTQLRLNPTTLDRFPSGHPRAMVLTFEATWRQWPGMNRLRRLRWRVIADAQGNVVLRTGREQGLLSTVFADMLSGVGDALSEVFAAVRRLF